MIEATPQVDLFKARDEDSLEGTIREASLCEYARAKNWHIASDPQKQWIRCTEEPITIPGQGWKLHVSADITSAETLLRRVLPILLTESSAFKVVASLQKLTLLNQGRGGASQVGKFITVYPLNDQEAVRLASKLDEATRDLSGPTVPSDHPLRPGSCVSYRYGGMAARLSVQTPLGKIEPAIRTPENTLIPDRRQPYYEAPAWARDPFLEAGIATELPKLNRLIDGRYLILGSMSLTVNHSIYLAADLEHARSCVIKGPGYAGLNNPSWTTLHTSVQHEAEILARLTPDPHVPAFYELVEQDDTFFLIMEDIEGKTLDKYMNTITNQGQYLPIQQVITWGREMAELFETIHAKGLVYGDLKSSNVIVGKNGRLYLIDFDIAHQQGDMNPRWRGRGTPGYMSPQMREKQPVTVADDIYGLGALLYFLLTNAEPSAFPSQDALPDRPIELLRPGVGTSLKAVVAGCLHGNPAERYRSMTTLKEALIAIDPEKPSLTISSDDNFTNECDPRTRAHFRQVASRLLDTICSVAEPVESHNGLVWTSTHPLTYGLRSRDINTGNAGVVLALAELAAELAEPRAQSALAQGAQWLRSAPHTVQQPLPGLYVGEAGVGAALLRAGQVLHDENLVKAAIERGKYIATQPYASPDVYNGTAGRLLFHLLLWDETREYEHLGAAVVCGEQLLRSATWGDHAEVYWTMPEGYEEMSGKTALGYAHGAAGIADALLDLFEATGDERFLSLVQGAGRWLLRQAVPALDDESGLGWPTYEGEAPTPAFWCRGGAGIARFFLHAARCDVLPGAREITEQAARTVARSTRWASPTRCHGLAGNIELLLDVYQEYRDRFYLHEAFTFGKLLEAFAVEQDARLVFPSDIPYVFTPDYQIGYSGIAVCFLRLSAPEYLPHQLSRAGFRPLWWLRRRR